MARLVFVVGLGYLAGGVIVGLGFVIAGVTRALPGSPAVSTGARVLLLPGAILLWPLIVARWVGGRISTGPAA